MAGRLENRVAIVTGGGHGIGKAYARRLAGEGARVVIAELDEAAAHAVARELAEAGHQALAVATDVSDPASCQRMAAAAMERFGRIDVLVNNAAIFATVPMSRAAFDKIAVEEWDRMMSVNVKGTWLACLAVIPHMRARGYGKIINISSSTSIKGSPSRIHYVTSKAGVIGFTKTLANEVGGDNICVNCVAPGSTLSEENPDEGVLKMRGDAASVRALKRVQTPEDLTGAVLFFASSDSDFITGQTLVVDGGNCLH
ncbi:MAG: glucose 1-dehydrogenase [Pigmentiphaga sp.]|uniref:SDR family NAD(P)-dependent oxidoreductase n=1 Tax=Pigmentiphaga sp. TaxID=1977564 RepID=UPI0029B6A332|nr:glucose 1-dehydrogenase [Pigmentiphaga sp.]MDX3907184.1 glucose 1-dehydrogenase [Pigmentiphaga sp.]